MMNLLVIRQYLYMENNTVENDTAIQKCVSIVMINKFHNNKSHNKFQIQ